MSDDRRQSDIDLAVVRRDVEWIRETLQEADLVNRVDALERGQDRIMAAIRTIVSGVLLIGGLVGAAHTIGLL